MRSRMVGKNTRGTSPILMASEGRDDEGLLSYPSAAQTGLTPAMMQPAHSPYGQHRRRR